MAGLPSVVEIGPGPGILTGPLSDSAQVVALEVDARMPKLLSESAPAADIRLQDALKADLGGILDSLPAPRAIVSNLPYYITGPLLERIAQVRDRIECATLMMQREVAQRILAKPGDSERGALSVVLQAQFKIELVCQVPAGAFLPPPKVDSTVLKFTPRIATGDAAFSRVVHFGFAQRRKTLSNNLIAAYKLGRPEIETLFNELGIKPTARAQELDEDTWLKLAERFRGS